MGGERWRNYEPLIAAAVALLRASPHIGASGALHQASRKLNVSLHPEDRRHVRLVILSRADVPMVGDLVRVVATDPDYAGEEGLIVGWFGEDAEVRLYRGGMPCFALKDLEVLK